MVAVANLYHHRPRAARRPQGPPVEGCAALRRGDRSVRTGDSGSTAALVRTSYQGILLDLISPADCILFCTSVLHSVRMKRALDLNQSRTRFCSGKVFLSTATGPCAVHPPGWVPGALPGHRHRGRLQQVPGCCIRAEGGGDGADEIRSTFWCACFVGASCATFEFVRHPSFCFVHAQLASN